MALESGRTAGRGNHRYRDHDQALPRGAAAVSGVRGPVPEPILNLHWPYLAPEEPTTEEIAKEINGYVLEDVADAQDPTKIALKAGQQVDSFAQLRDDGKNRLRMLDLLRLLHQRR